MSLGYPQTMEEGTKRFSSALHAKGRFVHSEQSVRIQARRQADSRTRRGGTNADQLVCQNRHVVFRRVSNFTARRISIWNSTAAFEGGRGKLVLSPSKGI